MSVRINYYHCFVDRLGKRLRNMVQVYNFLVIILRIYTFFSSYFINTTYNIITYPLIYLLIFFIYKLFRFIQTLVIFILLKNFFSTHPDDFLFRIFTSTQSKENKNNNKHDLYKSKQRYHPQYYKQNDATCIANGM